MEGRKKRGIGRRTTLMGMVEWGRAEGGKIKVCNMTVGEEALRKDRSVLKGRVMVLKERRAREEERCKEGREGVEKEIALGREKVEGVES
jgi:hypothetical protein